MILTKETCGLLLRTQFMAQAEHFTRYSGGQNHVEMADAMLAIQQFNADQAYTTAFLAPLPVEDWIPALAQDVRDRTTPVVSQQEIKQPFRSHSDNDPVAGMRADQARNEREANQAGISKRIPAPIVKQ